MYAQLTGDDNGNGYSTVLLGTSSAGPFNIGGGQLAPGNSDWRALVFTQLTPGTPYYAKVTYYDDDGVIGANPQVIGPIVTLSSAPNTLTVEPSTAVAGDSEILVTTPVRNDANLNSGFTVDVATAPGGPWANKCGASWATDTRPCRARSLTPGTDYWIRVTASDPDGVVGPNPQILGPVRYNGAANVAFGKPITADSGWGCCPNPAELVDGRVQYEAWYHGFAWTGGTGWWAGPPGIKRATIDLGQPTTITRAAAWYQNSESVPLVWGFQYSSDGVTFTSGATVNQPFCRTATVNQNVWWGYASCGHTATFGPVVARYFRYWFDDTTLFNGMHGWATEIEVFGPSVPVDTTPPVITPSISGTPGNNGWYRSDVTVSWTVSDPESPITSTSGCGTTTLTADTPGVTLTCTATSAGGTASQSVTIKIDKTPPVLSATRSPAPNAAGWNNADVTVTFSCTDNLSGVASQSGPTVVTTEGANQAVPGSCTDGAGNTASLMVSGISIDKTLPVLTATRSPAPNAAGWNNSDVTVTFACTDNLSGVASYSTPVVVTTQGASQAVTGNCMDVAGNPASLLVSGINIDKMPPVLTATRSPAPNAAGWNNSDVTVSFGCTDNLSGVASQSGPAVVTTQGANQSVTGSCTDGAGNVAFLAVSNINIDKTAPSTANVAVVPNPVPVNTGVTLSGDLSDTGGSNLASADYTINAAPGATITVSGATAHIDTPLAPFATTGVYQICLRAQDAAGNLSPYDCLFLPVYDPTGGFVTGGGWIMSPAGAYTADPSLTGKATFGFVSKYRPGATVPGGDTQFHFHAAGMKFQSTAYEWLVIAGARAQYKGAGTINGAGAYQFLLTAIDGNLPGGGGTDRFRIKIWGAGGLVYDNQMGAEDQSDPTTSLGGGSIVIHKQ